MPATSCTKTTSCNAITPKIQTEDVATLTDPWTPVCQKCLEKEIRPSPLPTNFIDVKEYAKALNYINSIHAMLNESLSLKNCDSQTNSVISLTRNFSMPDLPNFLAVFSCLTANDGATSSNRSKEVGLSRTTSTTYLDKSDHNTQITQTCYKNSDEVFEYSDLQHISYEEDFERKLQQRCDKAVHDSRTYRDIYEIDEISENSSTVYYTTRENYRNTKSAGDSNRNDHASANRTSNNRNSSIINRFNKQHNENVDTQKSTLKKGSIQQRETDKIKHVQQEKLKTKRQNYEKQGTVNFKQLPHFEHLDHPQLKQQQHNKKESRQPGKYIIISNNAIEEIDYQEEANANHGRSNASVSQFKKNKKENIRKQPIIQGDKGKSYELQLSDAELDRFASELLLGKEFEFCKDTYDCYAESNTAVGNKPRSPRPHSASSNQIANSGPERNRSSIRVKPMTPKSKENLTGIPVRQNILQECSSKKLRKSTSASMSPKSSFLSNSVLFTAQNKTRAGCRNIRTADDGLTREEKHKQTFNSPLYNKQQTLSVSALPQYILPNQVESQYKPKRIERRQSRSPCSRSSTVLAANSSGELRKIKHNPTKKFPTTNYKVQRKDDDDFICNRRNKKSESSRIRKLSSESVIVSDRASPCTTLSDSDINDDNDHIPKKDKNLANIHGFSRRSYESRNDITNTYKEPSQFTMQEDAKLGNIRYVVPLRTKVKTPFRQERKRSPNSEEDVLNITDYLQPPKTLYRSPSNSNISHTTGSSDIKSDRDHSP